MKFLFLLLFSALLTVFLSFLFSLHLTILKTGQNALPFNENANNFDWREFQRCWKLDGDAHFPVHLPAFCFHRKKEANALWWTQHFVLISLYCLGKRGVWGRKYPYGSLVHHGSEECQELWKHYGTEFGVSLSQHCRPIKWGGCQARKLLLCWHEYLLYLIHYLSGLKK